MTGTSDGTPRWTFAGWNCPCGASQLDPDRMYCETCIVAMGLQMEADLDTQSDDGTAEVGA